MSEDRTSPAAQYARSQRHLEMMLDLTVEEARRKLELFEKLFPRAAQFRQQMIDKLRTGTQTAREGPAKPSLVGSTPTPCSRFDTE